MALLVGVQAVELRSKLTATATMRGRSCPMERSRSTWLPARRHSARRRRTDPSTGTYLDAFIQPKVWKGSWKSVSSGGTVMEAIASTRQSLAALGSAGSR